MMKCVDILLFGEATCISKLGASDVSSFPIIKLKLGNLMLKLDSIAQHPVSPTSSAEDVHRLFGTTRDFRNTEYCTCPGLDPLIRPIFLFHTTFQKEYSAVNE